MNIVLVHGAWADGSSWDAVIPRLLDAGHTVVAVQLPLSSLADDVAATRRACEGSDVATVYVGHSYGGAVITNAASGALDVIALVYISAFIPDRDETLDAIVKTFPAPSPALGSLDVDSGGFGWLPVDVFTRDFAPDIAPDRARVMARVQKPIHDTIFETKSGIPAWREIPSWALISEDDRMIHPETQRRMAERAKATIARVPGGHTSLVSHPRETVDLILSAATSSVASSAS